ncbi:PRPS21 [Auxenochlorella protothecoides x Auxenochlorella symbiontica]
MLTSLNSAFAGLSLRPPAQARRPQPFLSSRSKETTVMKSRHTFQVEIVVGSEEPQDIALKRFKREVMNTGLVQEVRRRRRFENKVEAKKRKNRENQLRAKRVRQYGSRAQKPMAGLQGPSVFTDLFGSLDDIFADDFDNGATQQPRQYNNNYKGNGSGGSGKPYNGATKAPGSFTPSHTVNKPVLAEQR